MFPGADPFITAEIAYRRERILATYPRIWRRNPDPGGPTPDRVGNAGRIRRVVLRSA